MAITRARTYEIASILEPRAEFPPVHVDFWYELNANDNIQAINVEVRRDGGSTSILRLADNQLKLSDAQYQTIVLPVV